MRYGEDPRKGVQLALATALRSKEKARVELKRLDGLYARLDTAADDVVIVGIDEVGRGALAGPLLVAAVVLPTSPRINGIDDSKRLTAKQRQGLVPRIREIATAIGMARIEAVDIDRIGMAMALRQAMQEALRQIDLEPDLVLVDGNKLGVHPKELAIVGGDGKEAPIAAASIVAKVARDAWMVEADRLYPGYRLAANKGYASPEHIAALQELGPSKIHRRSFLNNILPAQERLF